MKKAAETALQDAREHIASVNDGYLQLFDQLLIEARDEREQEEERR